MAEQLKPRKRKTAPTKKPHSKTIKSKSLEAYSHDDHDYLNWKPPQINNIPDLVYHLETNPSVMIEAVVYGVNKTTKEAKAFRLNREGFIKTFKENKVQSINGTVKFREHTKPNLKEGIDVFGTDSAAATGPIGDDYTPLLGGPFNKQLYLYDYLKMHSVAFQASTHDPILKTAISIINEFVLGRGFRVDCDNKSALILWDAFAEANNLQQFMWDFCRELTIYGEQFVWWLPNNETKIGYQLPPEQKPPVGLLPRIRPMDPSTVWEIVTYPEDITRKLYAQVVFPTQYQIYTGSDKGKPVPSTKFIYQQIPASDFEHYKINSVSNEKRGRSELFPVLGYAKRLRDSVNYSIIGLQKSTAWSIDTEIDGDQNDIDNYINDQQSLGTIPPPGSEFVHSTKVKRVYASNNAASKGGQSQAFDWCFSMICAGLGIPQSYFATHLAGGNTRATAVVATEPITKKLEMRQALIEKVLQDMAAKLFGMFGIRDAKIEVTFPDLITQDRSAKLKDLALAETMKWVSNRDAAQVAAKELGLDKYSYEETQLEIIKDGPEPMAPKAAGLGPLTSPGLSAPAAGAAPADGGNNALTSQDRKQIGDNGRA